MVVHFDTGLFQQRWQGRDFEDAGHAGALRAAADHFGRSAGSQQQAQSVDDDGFSAAGFAR